MEPFLRWAGGKTWLKDSLNNYLPRRFNNYHEPFLGGGSIFFYTDQKRRTYLSDLNKDLIYTYLQVRDSVDEVLSFLREFRNIESDYYDIRQSKFINSSQKAAQFIYLNMTSFNGLYRVNRKGEYNVPFGHRYKVDFIHERNLRLASQKLSLAEINCLDFEEALKKVERNDFVFLDPPYTVAHSNNGFIGYNQKLFSIEDQYRLARSIQELNRVGAKFILTNAYHEKIADIYRESGDFITLSRMSLIGGKGATRQPIKEYLIKNY